MSKFRTILSGKYPLLIDGAMGTMLQARGMGIQTPAYFCMQNSDILRSIHEEYIQAGANVILTSTFGGTRFKLPKDMDVREFNRTMAQVVRQAATNCGKEVFIGGDIGSTGHFPKPLGDISPQDLFAAYVEQVEGLVSGGVDLLFIETQFDLAEVRLAVAAVRQVCDLPVAVSMTFEQGVTLTGSTPEIFAATMHNMNIDVVGVNCGAGPEQMQEVVERLLKASPLPVFAEPNAGLPELIGNDTVFRLPPEAFAEKTAHFAKLGTRMLGGCCGTSPQHIAALAQAVHSLGEISRPSRPLYQTENCISLTTRNQIIKLGLEQPIQIIGERINPTGKKALQAELLDGQFGLALNFAKEQVQAGANILDVNVGAPMVDESIILPLLTEQLVNRYSQPLSLDSSNPEAIATALPWLTGSGLVNSISGEHERMQHLGPLCKNWGSPFILLPIQGRNLPVKAEQRIAIIEKMLLEAEALGIPKHLIIVDVLALSVASSPQAAVEGLKTIEWCKKQGLPSLIGLSNISFGLPARDLINAGFLSMCGGAGLSACIANPSSARISEAVASLNVLLGQDDGAAYFIENYANFQAQVGSTSSKNTNTAITATLEDAIIKGDRDNVIALVNKALDDGADPFELVQQRLIPAITEVGKLYEQRQYFLPQLLRSAETMQIAFARVKPLLEKDGVKPERPVIILATVEGDIHDIGKNIVSLMLANHGFEVVDLGKDVKATTIVEAAIQHKASIIGLSALMTTTMIHMEDTVKLVKDKNLKIKVIIGGAVVTDNFAKRIGAHGYSTDAVDAVRLANSLLA